MAERLSKSLRTSDEEYPTLIPTYAVKTHALEDPACR